MKTGVINSRWFALNPAMRLDPAYWLKVLEQLHTEGIAADKATDEQVKAVITKVESALDQATVLRGQARQLEQRAQQLEQVMLTFQLKRRDRRKVMKHSDLKIGDVFKLKPTARIQWLVFGKYKDSGIIAVRCDSEIGLKLLAWIRQGRPEGAEPCTRAEIKAVQRDFWHDDINTAVLVSEQPTEPCQSVPVTDVIFRVCKWSNSGSIGNIIALFPAVPEDAQGRYCLMYQHVGQHSGADYLTVVQQTRLAKPEQYADLKKELESEPYNYVLRVCKRQTPKHRRQLQQTLKEWLTRNQDSGIKSTLAEGSDAKPSSQLCEHCASVPATLFTDEGKFCSELCLRSYREDCVSGRLDSEVLDSTVNTAAMEDRIAAAARKELYIPNGPLQTDFKHGRWYVSNADTGEEWSVEDASGPGSTDSFKFEKIREADDSGADEVLIG